MPFVLRNPSVVDMKVKELLPKIYYLVENLGGTPSMLRKFPTYVDRGVHASDGEAISSRPGGGYFNFLFLSWCVFCCVRH